MDEAGLSYRAWLPVAAAPFLMRETMARAAEAVDADWSEQIARLPGPRVSRLRHRGLGLALTGALAALLLLVVLTARTHDGAPLVAQEPAAEEIAVAEEPDAEPAEAGKTAKTAKKKGAGGSEQQAGLGAVTREDETAKSGGGEPAGGRFAAHAPRGLEPRAPVRGQQRQRRPPAPRRRRGPGRRSAGVIRAAAERAAAGGGNAAGAARGGRPARRRTVPGRSGRPDSLPAPAAAAGPLHDVRHHRSPAYPAAAVEARSRSQSLTSAAGWGRSRK